jgi:hypothetical protein
MRTFISRLLSFSVVTAFLIYTSSPAAAQRRPLKQQVVVQTTDGEPSQAVHPPQYAPKEVEPVDPQPNFNNLFAPQISPVFGAWTSIGPTPLANGINYSGRIVGIAAHPTDANTIYIAAAGGGVWKTTNGGTSWTPLTDTQRTLSMGCIALSKSNPLHVYAGTGEANNSGDSNFGRGILTSTNGGTTWSLQTGPAGAFDNSRLTCSQIAVDPTNENVAYAAMGNIGFNGIFPGSTGIYKTTNGGTTWTNVTAANGKESSASWSDVVIDPNTPTTIYASVGAYYGVANNAVYKSTDSGATWTQLSAANAPVGASFGRLSLGLSTAVAANVLYVSAEGNTSTNAASGLARAVRSDDGGTTFNLLTTPNYMGAQGWYDQDLTVDPTSSAIAYFTGAANGNSILRTSNSGGAYTDISSGGASPHVDHHATAFDANGKLLDGNDGGIWRLESTSPVTWTDLNGNLATIQFQGIGLHPTNSQIVVGGSQDNGTEVYNGTGVWTVTDGGDGGPVKFSQTNTSRVYRQSPIASFGAGAFFRRSDNSGATWTSIVTGMSGDTTQNFYAPFTVDPANGDHVLYGATHVWQTINAGGLWTAVATPASGGFNSSGNNVDAIGIGASSASTIYTATGGTFATTSQIFLTTNGGTSWTEHDLPANSGRVNEIQVDPANSQIAYAVTNTFSTGGNVFKTINGGTTWTNITGNLATVTACTCAIPVWSLQVDSIASKLYIGADDGVYVSLNGGTTWARYGTGFPNAQVFQIELNQTLHILGAATHGRGAWEILTQSTTAADVSVSGRVLTSAGSGIRGATVTMMGADGNVRRVMTNAFGYYSFEDVPSGGAYTFTAASRGFNFSPRVINLNDAVSDLDFTGSH